jgi:hypothetical protein
MPILPLTHPEPFAATLGVMLYPAIDEFDRPRARAFAAQYLAEPLRRFHAAGHILSYDALSQIAMDAGEKLNDLDQRWEGGLATGDLFKTLFVLAESHPELASWENTTRIYEVCAIGAKCKGARSALWRERSRFLTVAHLWAAWSIRDGKFGEIPEVGYDGFADFQSFLTEAEILRDFGQQWRSPRAKSKPPLPAEVWRVPEGWEPPARQPDWPNSGAIPSLKLPPDLISTLKSSGRPRKGR